MNYITRIEFTTKRQAYDFEVGMEADGTYFAQCHPTEKTSIFTVGNTIEELINMIPDAVAECEASSPA